MLADASGPTLSTLGSYRLKTDIPFRLSLCRMCTKRQTTQMASSRPSVRPHHSRYGCPCQALRAPCRPCHAACVVPCRRSVTPVDHNTASPSSTTRRTVRASVVGWCTSSPAHSRQPRERERARSHAHAGAQARPYTRTHAGPRTSTRMTHGCPWGRARELLSEWVSRISLPKFGPATRS